MDVGGLIQIELGLVRLLILLLGVKLGCLS